MYLLPLNLAFSLYRIIAFYTSHVITNLSGKMHLGSKEQVNDVICWVSKGGQVVGDDIVWTILHWEDCSIRLDLMWSTWHLCQTLYAWTICNCNEQSATVLIHCSAFITPWLFLWNLCISINCQPFKYADYSCDI